METHIGVETCLPNDFPGTPTGPLEKMLNMTREEFLLTETVRRSYRIIVSGF